MSFTRQFLDGLSHEQLLARLNLALEGASLGIWDWDLRDDSVQFDRRWCEMLGLDHASTPMALSTWSSRVHPDDLDRCYADVKAHLEGKTARYENVHRMRHADGEWLFILDRGRISGRDEQGKPIRFTGTHFDLTASERAKQAIARHELELAELVANLPTAVALLDTQLRYVTASAQWSTAHGLAGISLRGQLHEVLCPKTSPRWKDIFRRALAGESQQADEERFDDRWLRWSARPWLRAGQVEGILVSFEDVTDAVATRYAREKERASRLEALAVFAGGVAHEINSPLQVIGIEAELLVRELSADKPQLADLRESAESLAATAKRAMSVTRALRTLSRDASADALEAVPVTGLFDNVRALCQSRFASANVDLSFVEGTTQGQVSGRPSELLHMLLNLVDNALHAAREGARWVRLEAQREGAQVVLRCVDGGPGVAPENVAKLMSPFFTTKPQGIGTGLGLSIVRSLAERSGGTFAFLQGAAHTTFELRLPAREG